MNPQTTSKTVWKWQDGGARAVSRRDALAIEEPLEIQLDTRSISVTMRTPGHDEELATGFLLAEGLIQSRRQIQAVRPHPRNRQGHVMGVFLRPGVTVDLSRLERHGVTTSSCGLCGKTTIEAVHQRLNPLDLGPWRLRAAVLLKLPEKLRRSQEAFGQTGGLHAAGIFGGTGRLVVCREDVGRHNAVDKVLGYGVLQGKLPWRRHVLLVSGRASFEILQKSLAARIPVVAAISAPSSLAVEFARRSGQTLVGFLRDGTMNVYTHRERLRFG